MSRLKGYWKTALASIGAAAGYLATVPIDALPAQWKAAITGLLAVAAVLVGPANKPAADINERAN